jgi:quercetin dioxygenase-like cupin family protein
MGKSMNRRLLLLCTCFIASQLIAQPTGPSDSRGGGTTQLAALDLATQIDSVAGRQLRMRAVTLDPSGHLAAHSHDGRPTLEYVLKGTVIEYRNGVAIEHHAGEVIVGEKGVSHWWENHGTEQVVLLPVDVFRP